MRAATVVPEGDRPVGCPILLDECLVVGSSFVSVYAWAREMPADGRARDLGLWTRFRAADRLVVWVSFLPVVGSTGLLTSGQGDTPDLGGRRRVENPRLSG